MAKTDNLTDFLTGVADAIRTKKGTTAKINPQNFETEIGSIETGGMMSDVARKTINKTVEIVTADDLRGATFISDYVFCNCNKLTNITIPNSVTSIGNHAFEWCSGLTNVTIGNSVTSIGNFAFNRCGRITNIIIPDRVTSIGDRAFNGCSYLTKVTMLPTTPPTLGNDVFVSAVTTIAVPLGRGEAYKTADGWKNYANKIVEEIV